MAEIWYLSLDENFDGGDKAQYEYHIVQCIELLEIVPESWQCDSDSRPEIKTGDPLIDNSGYIHVFMRVEKDEVETDAIEDWKPGWYKSSLSIIGLENKIRKSPK